MCFSNISADMCTKCRVYKKKVIRKRNSQVVDDHQVSVLHSIAILANVS